MKMPVVILTGVIVLMATREKIVKQVNLQHIMFILILASHFINKENVLILISI
jgi:hypothetical protein